MKITKRDVGRPIIFQGFDHGIYEGYIDKVKTTEFGYPFAHIMYRVSTIPEHISVPLSEKNWNRLSFRVTD